MPHKGVPRPRDGVIRLGILPERGWEPPRRNPGLRPLGEFGAGSPIGQNAIGHGGPVVGRCKKLRPDLIEFEVGGLEHRPQARGFDGSGKVAAQVRKPLARYLGYGGHCPVEGPADIGKVERDCRRWLGPELREAGDRGAQVALARVRQAAITGKLIEDGLQRLRGCCRGEV